MEDSEQGFVKHWKNTIIAREPPDREEVRHYTELLYKHSRCKEQGFGYPLKGRKTPEIVWCFAPRHLLAEVAKRREKRQLPMFLQPLMPSSTTFGHSQTGYLPHGYESLEHIWRPASNALVHHISHDKNEVTDRLFWHARNWGVGCLHPSLSNLLYAKKDPQIPAEICESWHALGRNCAVGYLFTDTVFFLEKPTVLITDEGKLHCNGGAAVSWPGEDVVWALRGVEVPREIAETPAGILPPEIVLENWRIDIMREIIHKIPISRFHAELILKIQNVNVRKLLVEKIGMVRICEELDAEVKDRWRDYELLMLNIGNDRVRPFLKMVNPSTGDIHIEGVHPDCRSVKKALKWRNNTTELPKELA